MKIFKALVTLLLLFLVFRSVDLSKITHDLSSFNKKTLILLLIVAWAGQLLCSERWRIFAQALQMPGSYGTFVRFYFTGMFFNSGLPSLIGGDVIKAYLVSKNSEKPLHIGFASVIQDRIAGLMALLIYGSVAIVAYPISFKGIPLWTIYILLWIAVAGFFWFMAKGALHGKALRKVAELRQVLQVSRLKPNAIFRISLYSFIYSGLVLWVFQQVTVAAGYNVGIIQFSALFPLITVATMLPVTIGGLGVREWAYVEALALIGLPRGAGLVISLATSALFLLCNLGGIVFLPGRRLRVFNK